MSNSSRIWLAATWITAALMFVRLVGVVRTVEPGDFLQFYFAGKLAAGGQIQQL